LHEHGRSLAKGVNKNNHVAPTIAGALQRRFSSH
jgi:hypothetical protein